MNWWWIRSASMELDITIEDPVMYKKPLKVTELMPLMVGADLIEYVCGENERDVRHLVPGENSGR
jgi:hypothetical protein